MNMPTDADVDLVNAGRKLFTLMNTVRTIIDHDPVDVPLLETSLRQAIATIKATRDSLAAGLRDKQMEGMLDGYGNYCRMLLAVIDGLQD
jgi:hypothetical protein